MIKPKMIEKRMALNKDSWIWAERITSSLNKNISMESSNQNTTAVIPILIRNALFIIFNDSISSEYLIQGVF